MIRNNHSVLINILILVFVINIAYQIQFLKLWIIFFKFGHASCSLILLDCIPILSKDINKDIFKQLTITQNLWLVHRWQLSLPHIPCQQVFVLLLSILINFLNFQFIQKLLDLLQLIKFMLYFHLFNFKLVIVITYKCLFIDLVSNSRFHVLLITMINHDFANSLIQLVLKHGSLPLFFNFIHVIIYLRSS